MLNKNVRAPEVEEFRMNLDEAKTPLGKAGVAAPSRKMPEGTLFGADGVVRPSYR